MIFSLNTLYYLIHYHQFYYFKTIKLLQDFSLRFIGLKNKVFLLTHVIEKLIYKCRRHFVNSKGNLSTPQFQTDPLSSTHASVKHTPQFNTKKPSVKHQKPLSSPHPSVQHQKTEEYVELRSFWY